MSKENQRLRRQRLALLAGLACASPTISLCQVGEHHIAGNWRLVATCVAGKQCASARQLELEESTRMAITNEKAGTFFIARTERLQQERVPGVCQVTVDQQFTLSEEYGAEVLRLQAGTEIRGGTCGVSAGGLTQVPAAIAFLQVSEDSLTLYRPRKTAQGPDLLIEKYKRDNALSK
jgi:hypothetical protein